MFIPGRLYEFIGPLEPGPEPPCVPYAKRLNPSDQCCLYHVGGGDSVYLHAHSGWVLLSLGPYDGVNCFGWEKFLGPDGNQYTFYPKQDHWKETILHSSRAGDVSDEK
jgi:hypothetical protein